MEDIIMQIIEAFKSLGYFGIALALTLEFVPAEIVLPLAGYWVYEGDMNLYLAILFGSIGGVTGPLTLYTIGRFGGRPLVKKYGKYFLIKDEQIEKADVFFDKYGSGIAFFGRFIPGVRTAISIPCGVLKMNVWKFIGYTYLAMFPVSAAYVYIGYKLGPQWEMAGSLVGQYINYLIIPIAAGLILFILRKRAYKKRT